ncbi:hypothetical protein MMC14_002153 [Varicellaria rhodocarpa]|nr:hypothetical protein [Varicellaria rhodocarpa]
MLAGSLQQPVPTTAQKSRGFLNLPLELRLKIYRHLVTQGLPRCVTSDQSSLPFALSVCYGFYSAVLLTNHQISSEATHVFWGENVFWIRISEDFNFFKARTNLPVSQKLGKTYAIRKILMLFIISFAKMSANYPSHTMEAHLKSISDTASNICKALSHIHGLQVKIEWHDDTPWTKLEEKKGVLQALTTLSLDTKVVVSEGVKRNSGMASQLQYYVNEVMNKRSARSNLL